MAYNKINLISWYLNQTVAQWLLMCVISHNVNLVKVEKDNESKYKSSLKLLTQLLKFALKHKTRKPKWKPWSCAAYGMRYL